MDRLSAAIISWKDCLLGVEDVTIDTSMDTTIQVHVPFKAGGTPELEVHHDCDYGLLMCPIIIILL